MEISKLNRAGDRRGIHMEGRKLTEEHKNNIKLGCSKPICQFDKQMNFIKRWASTRETKISRVGDAANGKRRFAGGYIWKWEKDYNVEG